VHHAVRDILGARPPRQALDLSGEVGFAADGPEEGCDLAVVVLRVLVVLLLKTNLAVENVLCDFRKRSGHQGERAQIVFR
jgi:hypothetical protein